MASGRSMDLTKGSVVKNLLLFALPICATNLIQQLYHAADVMVVGNFAQNPTVSLAAVGSTTHVTSLLINLFAGLSIGSNVLCSNRIGAGDQEGDRRVMHTSVPLAALGGLFFAVVGFLLSRPLLEMVGSPHDVIDQATLYMKIIFLGQPASIVYNFGAGILRAHGDTKRPMYILTATGLVNVVLNLVFVIVFHLDAAGVALATIVAHYLSAALVLAILFNPAGEYRMKVSELKIRGEELRGICKVGIPAGLNSIVYSISNVVIVSALNTLGSVSIAASSAAVSVGNVIHTVAGGFSTACVSYAGQNYGAKRFDRIGVLFRTSILVVEAIFLVVNIILTLFPAFFLGLYTSEAAVIQTAIPKMLLSCWGYMLAMISEISSGCLRGMRRTLGPTLLNMTGVCATRLFWTLVVFPKLPVKTLGWLGVCYPLSFFVSAVILGTYFFVAKHLEEKKARASLSRT